MNTTFNLSRKKPLEPVTDEMTLVRLAQQGDQEMFARLYDAYVDRIYRYIYFRVADDDIVEDITSQVFLKVWENLGTYQASQSPFMAWLYRIAHNAVIDHYRTKKVAVALDDVKPMELSQNDEVDDKLDRQIQSQELRKALKTLTEEQQQVLILKFVGGLSTTEIAQQLGKQQGAVRALQMRGLQGLAKCPELQKEFLLEQR
jgi:RNA polymerase sigma-70 factor (ECF subfamily)